MELAWYEWLLAFFATVCLGISKAGLKGMGILMITTMAILFGARTSTGIVLPLLVVGDVMAVAYYNRHAQWKYVLRLMPWMVVGILIGVFTGKNLPEEIFKFGMAFLILIGVAVMYYYDRRSSQNVPESRWFGSSLGLMAGFATMIGNLAGAFANLYFLAMRMPKNNFIGSAAWLFFLMNLFKLPFHIFSWRTITPATLSINLKLVVFEIIGFFFGVWLIRMITDKFFRHVILFLTALGALVLLIK